MIFLKFLQSLVKALHSEGTPGQVAAGVALGSILGLTPLMNVHNAVVFGAVLLLNLSFPGAMLGWAVCIPVGFLLDPLFDRVGSLLLIGIPALTPLWTSLYNTPVIALSNFNNTVVLGSVTCALALQAPLFLGSRWAVGRYRATVGERIRQSRWYKAVTASKLYNIYRLFRPDD